MPIRERPLTLWRCYVVGGCGGSARLPVHAPGLVRRLLARRLAAHWRGLARHRLGRGLGGHRIGCGLARHWLGWGRGSDVGASLLPYPECRLDPAEDAHRVASLPLSRTSKRAARNPGARSSPGAEVLEESPRECRFRGSPFVVEVEDRRGVD